MVVLFCLLLISGIIAGQALDFSAAREGLGLITSVCLAYIMIEVGLEFSADKKDVRSYGWDFVTAAAAAVLPAVFWFIYFIAILKSAWQPAVLSGLSCAPTSAGVLFAMLLAAGLGGTWVFKKARTLAVLDDLVTILLLTPLQLVIHGLEWKSFVVVGIIVVCLFAAFRWQNAWNWPVSEEWILLYAAVLTAGIYYVKRTTNIHLEVLIPAFTLGCLIDLRKGYRESQGKFLSFDVLIKSMFMFLVGLSFPRVAVAGHALGPMAIQVLILTVLSNLGKSFFLLCYRKEASLRQRLALSIAMFPRGEVGAAVLLIGLGYGLGGGATTLAMLSLAFNLTLTGVFIWLVIRLVRPSASSQESGG